MLVCGSDFRGWVGGIHDGCECSGILGGMLLRLSLRDVSKLPGACWVDIEGERGNRL